MSEYSARVTAQAKINLFLRVGALMETDFHEIETVFQLLELGDEVVVRTHNAFKRELVCRGVDSETPIENNLALKAAREFADLTGWPGGFTIELEKQIPVGGGLGGGSSDAAAVLRILNHLSPHPLSELDLRQMALRLGSDVPFFLSGASLALARGRGEQLTTLQPLPVRGITLFHMPFSVSTRAAYGWLDSSRNHAGAERRSLRPVSPSDVTSWDDVLHLAQNDFEEVVCERHANLAVLLASARSADYALAEMTGSGSTVFAVAEGDEPVRAPRHVAPNIRQLLTRTATTPAEIGSEG